MFCLLPVFPTSADLEGNVVVYQLESTAVSWESRGHALLPSVPVWENKQD